jgi:hypothetical protein
MAGRKFELSDKQLTFILLALDAYVDTLEADEEDRGPSMADAMFVEHLAKQLREDAMTDKE